MKIKVTLNGSAGELNSQTFEVADNHPDFSEAVNLEASAVVEGWLLAAGDTITIREV